MSLIVLACALGAAAPFLSARLIAPENPYAHLSLAELEQIAGRQPGVESCQVAYGRRLLEAARPADAEKVLRSVVSGSPTSLEAPAAYACAIGLMGEWERGNELLREIEASDPGSPETHYYRGLLFAGGGDFRRATANIEEAVRRRPKDADMQSRLAQTYLMQGWMGEALKPAQRAAQLQPKRADFAIFVAELNMSVGNREKGTELLRDCLRRWPMDPTTNVSYARALLRQPNPEERNTEQARALLLKAQSLAPGWPDPHVEMARLYHSQDNAASALMELNQVPEVNRKSPDVAYLLGQIYRKLERDREANRVMKEFSAATRARIACSRATYLAEQSPDDPALHLQAARLLFDTHQRLPAIRHYYEVLRLQPENQAARVELEKVSRKKANAGQDS